VLGSLRILDGAAQAMESVVPEVLARPSLGLPCNEVASRTFDVQVMQPLVHVRVDLVEAARGVPRGEVRSPSTQDGIEVGDHLAEIRMAPSPWRPFAHLLPDSLHRASRRLAM